MYNLRRVDDRQRRWASNEQWSLSHVVASFLQHLNVDEVVQICRQFQSNTWRRNRQVLWSGIPRQHAQRGADERDMQTLTTAMGPWMDPKHPLCPKQQKPPKQWSDYVKGASALFAWHISRGERVVVPLPSPPDRFHAPGLTSYQLIEEPILKASAALRIEAVHPEVKGAENYSYQLWPADKIHSWVEIFGNLSHGKHCWRPVKGEKRRCARI